MTTIEFHAVSRWYGNVVAVNDISMTIGPGVTGLLGPNGAGKTTIMHMMAGFLAPSRGEITVAGQSSWRNPAMFRQVALVPERDSVYAFLTGAEFVVATAKLHGLPDPGGAARRAIEMLEMTEAQDRKIATYSKGMRQRIKVAAALVHDPEIVLLDEPFNGMDPRQRLHMMDLLHAQGDQGRVIVFSSHILEEVERLSGIIQVIVGGRLAASGDFRAIRRLMTNRPHVFLVRSSDDRALGSALIGLPAISGVELTGHGLQVRASDYGTFTRELAGLTPRPWHSPDPGAAGRRVAGKRLHLPAGVLMSQPNQRTGQPMSGLFNGVIIRLTLRATMSRKRALLFAVPAIILIGISALLKATASGNEWPPRRPRPDRLPSPRADGADSRRQRARRRDRGRQHRAPARHAGQQADRGAQQVPRRGGADRGVRGRAGIPGRGDRDRRGQQTGDRAVRRRAGRIGHLQRAVRDGDGGFQPQAGRWPWACFTCCSGRACWPAWCQA